MSEIRTRLLELAIKAGATIDNATKVATDWEKWATADADPLRLDVPAPVYSAHDLWHGACTPPKTEIDWSLSYKRYARCQGLDYIVRIEGPGMDDEHFEATVVSSSCPDMEVGYRSNDFLKSFFEYFGDVAVPKNNKK